MGRSELPRPSPGCSRSAIGEASSDGEAEGGHGEDDAGGYSTGSDRQVQWAAAASPTIPAGPCWGRAPPESHG
jgi:hypothetical protein